MHYKFGMCLECVGEETTRIRGRNNTPPAAGEGEGAPDAHPQQRYAVERLLGRRVAVGRAAGDSHRKGTVLYRVLWQGLDESEASWEPMSYLTRDLIDAFDRQQTEIAQPAAPSVEDVD